MGLQRGKLRKKFWTENSLRKNFQKFFRKKYFKNFLEKSVDKSDLTE